MRLAGGEGGVAMIRSGITVRATPGRDRSLNRGALRSVESGVDQDNKILRRLNAGGRGRSRFRIGLIKSIIGAKPMRMKFLKGVGGVDEFAGSGGDEAEPDFTMSGSARAHSDLPGSK